MKNILCLFLFTVFFSCGNEKVLLLPEIDHSDISEIKDVSAGYLFYDETQKDSIELNRKNLISTTNWLINVDKRLTLKQAIPQIKYLQEKKLNSSHKNKNAKNYFTCNDTSKKNLGFIEFTDIIYHEEVSWKDASKVSQLDFDKKLNIQIHSSKVITLVPIINDSDFVQSDISHLKQNIIDNLKNINDDVEIILDINKNIVFQEYISIKSKLLELDLKNVTLSNNEYIY